MPTFDDHHEPVNRASIAIASPTGISIPSVRFTPLARLSPLGGRVPGAAGRPVATAISFPPNLVPASDRVVVGVVDTGLVLRNNKPHPWLGRHVACGMDDEDLPPEISDGSVPEAGHGTFVAGLILMEAPGIFVRMIRALDTPDSTDARVAAAINTLASDDRVKVINLSFSGQSLEDPHQEGNRRALDGIRRALEQLQDRDVVVVAAAGNHATDQPVWPAAFDHVISVGAVDETVTWLQGDPPPKASFSAYGPTVDAYANGVNVVGPTFTFPPSGVNASPSPVWATWSGTSFACATVAGRIARVAADNECSAREAAREVLAGPKMPTPCGGGGKQPTYVASVTSVWDLTPAPGATTR